jgi:hypothetical protein
MNSKITGDVVWSGEKNDILDINANGRSISAIANETDYLYPLARVAERHRHLFVAQMATNRFIPK